MAGSAPTGKLQGFKSTFHFTVAGGASAVRLKSLSGWDLSVESPQINVDDHDTEGWADTLPGIAKATLSVKAVYFEGDATQQDLLTSFLSALQTTGGVLAATLEPINAVGGFVYQGDFIVTSFKHSTGVSDAQMLDISMVNRGALTTSTQAVVGA